MHVQASLRPNNVLWPWLHSALIVAGLFTLLVVRRVFTMVWF